MGFRITTSMMMSTYRYNLMNSTNRLSDARDKVLTQRNFNSYAEDPASAAQAFRLRRQWWQSKNQQDNNDATYNKFHTGWVNLQGIITDLSDTNGRVSAIRGTSGTAGESRIALAQVLRETADSVVQAMNQKVGDQFIFAGNDGLTVPFSWNGDHTELYYRGINVNAGSVEKPASAEPQWMQDARAAKPPRTDEYGVPSLKEREDAGITGALEPEEKEWLAYYNDQSDYQKLQKMQKEELNLDLGIGLQEIGGVLVNGSAFNSALCGLDFLNCGRDKDGDPQNLALVMKELADVFQAWDEDIDPQGYNPELAGPSAKGLTSEALAQKADRLLNKLNEAHKHTTEKYVELDARSAFLKTNSGRLSDQSLNLNEQLLDLEQIDLADAITAFSWDQYCYNSALKIGNQLLSQSLIDYMN